MPPIAIVTGSTRGLGRATAERLAARGHTVVVAGRDAGLAHDVADQLRRSGQLSDHVALDVTSTESVAAAARN